MQNISDRKRAAARANGAKAAGRKTPAGKARSAMNALKHGITANTLILSTEDESVFDQLHAAYMDRFRPIDSVEQDFVDEMVLCKWRQRRLWDVEGAALDLEIERQRARVDEEFSNLSNDVRTALAYETQADQLSRLSRYESRLSFQFHRARKALLELQNNRPPHVTGAPPLAAAPNEANPSSGHTAAEPPTIKTVPHLRASTFICGPFRPCVSATSTLLAASAAT